MLLADDDEGSVSELVESSITNSNDEQIQQFVKFTRPAKRHGSPGGHFLVAAAELVLASFLIIAGLATVLPSVIGLTSPQELVNFIAQITSSLSLQTLSNPVVPALELMLAVLLLFGAFHTVRLAASNLTEVGVVRHPSPTSKLGREATAGDR